MSYIKHLKRFNEKANKLLNLDFSKNLKDVTINIYENKSIISIKLLDNEIKCDLKDGNEVYEKQTVKEIGPWGEQFDSYILNIRFFIQDNDSFSINNLSNLYTQNNLIYKRELIAVRNNLNIYLDGIVILHRDNSQDKHKKISRRDILDFYIYGEYAHSNPRKKEMYNKLKFGDNNNWSFFQTIRVFNNYLNEIININQLELNKSS